MLGSNGSGWALWKGGTIEYSIGIYKGALREKTVGMVYESKLEVCKWLSCDYSLLHCNCKMRT